MKALNSDTYLCASVPMNTPYVTCKFLYMHSYDACNFSDSLVNGDIPGSLLAVNSQGVNTLFVEVTEPGTYYYACGIPGHCFARQKITVVVR